MSLSLVLVTFVSLILSAALCNNVTIQNRDIPKSIPDSVSNYAFDNRKAKYLSILEEHIYDSLSLDRHQFANVPICDSQVSKYLADFERDLISRDYARGEAKAMDVVQNPFLMLRQLRRIYQTLLHDVAKGCEGHAKVRDNVEKLFTTYKLPLVIERDFQDALRGILRFHYIYGFNATRDLRKGIIGGVDTGVLISVEDCAVLAKAALDIYEAPVLGYQWIIAAEEIQIEESLDGDEDIRAKLRAVWTGLKKLTKLNTKQEIKEKLNGKIQKSLNGKEDLDDYDYFATCRGESFLTQEELSQRFCYYESTFHPYLLLNPAKTEYISFDPVIFQIHDFLSPSENSYIDKYLGGTMMPATLINLRNGQLEMSAEPRITTEILNPKDHLEMERMFVKEEAMTGLITRNTSRGHFPLAVYNSFDYLNYHYDNPQISYDDLKETGHRMVTITYYLTDVELGGATAFPEVGVWATPVQNSAIFWFNLKENGHLDERMIHGGCPVLLGTKKIATKFILQNYNIFKRPCPLHAAPKKT